MPGVEMGFGGPVDAKSRRIQKRRDGGASRGGGLFSGGLPEH